MTRMTDNYLLQLANATGYGNKSLKYLSYYYFYAKFPSDKPTR